MKRKLTIALGALLAAAYGAMVVKSWYEQANGEWSLGPPWVVPLLYILPMIFGVMISGLLVWMTNTHTIAPAKATSPISPAAVQKLMFYLACFVTLMGVGGLTLAPKYGAAALSFSLFLLLPGTGILTGIAILHAGTNTHRETK